MLRQTNLSNYYNDFMESIKIELEPEDVMDIDEMIHEWNLRNR